MEKKYQNLLVQLLNGLKRSLIFLNYQLGQINLLEFYKKNPNFILPTSRKNEVVKFVEKGLKDLSISRTSFTWGIPVPKNKNMLYMFG